MRKYLKNALRLNWSEISYYISGFISEQLGRNIVCKASPEDDNYWDIAAVNTQFTRKELRLLLGLVYANDFIYHESLPEESDKSVSLGMDLSEALLKIIISSTWHHRSIYEDGLWLIGIDEKSIKLPRINTTTLLIDNCAVDTSMLMSKDMIMQKLDESHGKYSDLSQICNENHIRFGNQLYWHFPLPDSRHSGYYLVLAKEGVLSIPYDSISDTNEKLELEDAFMCSWSDMIDFEKRLHEYSHHTEKILSILEDYLEKQGGVYDNI